MTLTPLERIATQTLLGIRFWDPLLNQPVSSGLMVRAQRLSDDRSRRVGRPVIGRATPSGVIAFFGISSAERADDDPANQIWETVPPEQIVVVEVKDLLGRYLPISFEARLPFRGPFRGRGQWLGTPLLRPEPSQGEELGVYLWSAPTRKIPAGLATIRAQIVVGDGAKPAPAAYAFVEAAQPDGDHPPDNPFRHFGLADENGTLILPLPYPPVPDPENGHYPSLAQQAFPLTITMRYDQDARESLPGSDLPNLESILDQSRADVGTHWTGGVITGELHSAETFAATLTFGQPLLLRTADDSPDAVEDESVLRILPT